MRTQCISSKPTPGTALFDSAPVISSKRVHNGVNDFQLERSIYGLIRSYTLRGSKHWKAVQSAVSSQQASLAHFGDSVHSRDDARDYQAAAKLVHDKVFEALYLKQLPAGIREHVLAHMMKDHKMQIHDEALISVGSTTHENGENANNGVRAGPGLNRMSGSLSLKGSESSKTRMYLTVYEKGILVTNMHVSEKSLMNQIHLLKSEDDQSKRNISGQCLNNKIHQEENLGYMRRRSCSLGCRIMERAYGTAPIWYQQSMETGPPIPGNSL
jgi:hypothetical protein